MHFLEKPAACPYMVIEEFLCAMPVLAGKGISVPYQDLPDGLYLLKRPSPDKGVDHYGVLDIGDRFGLAGADGVHPIVAHQTPPSVTFDWLQNTGDWYVIGQVTDEDAAIARLRVALSAPGYDLFGHNCEHFARFVTTGSWESKQLQTAGLVAGLAALTVASWYRERRA